MVKTSNPNRSGATHRISCPLTASLIPLLTESCREITLIDTRSISPAVLGKFVSFDAQGMPLLCSTSVRNGSTTIK